MRKPPSFLESIPKNFLPSIEVAVVWMICLSNRIMVKYGNHQVALIITEIENGTSAPEPDALPELLPALRV